MDYLQALEESREQTAALLQALRETKDQETFRSCVAAYARTRFLVRDLTDTEDIGVLAAESIARIYSIPREKLLQSDKPSGCTLATSVADKKVLLLLSLQKAVGVKLPPERTPKIRTLGSLADVLWEAKQGRTGEDQ